jgi:hypothetical protein
MIVAGKKQSKLLREDPVPMLPLCPPQPHTDCSGNELGQPQ